MSDNEPPRFSRHHYARFLDDYKRRRLDALAERPSRETLGEGDQKRAAKAADTLRGTYLRNYLRWLRPRRWEISLVITLAIVTAGIQMLEPLFMRYVVDGILLDRSLATSSRASRLHLAGAAFLTIVIINAVLGLVREYRQRLLNVRITLSLRRALFERLLRSPIVRLWDMKTGGILSRLTGDVDATSGLLQTAVVAPSIAIIRLVVATVILTTLNWRLSLTALSIIPGAMFMSFVAARRVRPIYRSMRRDAQQVDGRVGETFVGIRVVRAFGAERREALNYMIGRHALLRKELFAQRRELTLVTLWGLLLSGVNVGIVWYGGWLHLRGQASVGDIMAFQWYTFLILAPASSIVNSFTELQRSLAAMERVFDILGLDDDKPDRPGAVDAPAVVRELRFDGVEFAYRDGHPAVRDFDVVVPGGAVVALIGRSGAGKSTVTDLVARFHDPTRGRVLLNGIDLRDLRLGSYRSLLAVVQQDVFLFDGTMRDNIAYGRHDATEAEVIDAAHRAHVHEFITRMPDGYDTLVGERGVKLSGGQRQRLAIARAILASPQILILDEATSNLDTESEQLIQLSMSSLLEGRTTFVVAHRLSTIRRADLILLLEDGRIVECGTHEELMTARGVYRRMVLRQTEIASEDGSALWQ